MIGSTIVLGLDVAQYAVLCVPAAVVVWLGLFISGSVD